jgi:hypothetical protein
MIKLTTYDDLKNQINKNINKYKISKKIKNEQEFDMLKSSLDPHSRQFLMLNDLIKANSSIDKIKIFNRQKANSHFYSDIADKASTSNIQTILRSGKTKFAKKDKDLGIAQFTSNSPFSHTLHKDITKLNALKSRRKTGYVNNILKPRDGQTVEFERIENVNIKIDSDSGLAPVNKDLISADLTDEVVLSQLEQARNLIVGDDFASGLKAIHDVTNAGQDTSYKLPHLRMYQVFIAALIQQFVSNDGKYAGINAYPPMRDGLRKMMANLTTDGSLSVSKLPYGIRKPISDFVEIVRQKAIDLELTDSVYETSFDSFYENNAQD